MPGYRWICFFLAGFLCLIEPAKSQTVTIQSITISGLKHTRSSIVYRELNFAEGDTLLQSEIGETLERNKNNLYNLGLFNEVIVNVSEWDTRLNRIEITIEVKESWYIYVVPILDLADRNFNVWWTTYNHALDRINLGARLEWLNFTGRNDKIKAKFQVGYTPKQEIEYRFPFLNRKQSLGVTTGFSHSINKEVSYASEDNQQLFVKLDERKVQETWQGQARAFYRPSFFLKYEVSLAYHYIKVAEEVVTDYNPYYFRNGDNIHTALSMQLSFDYDNRDFKIFPAKGLKAALSLEKIGLGEQDDENSLKTTVTLEWNTTTGRRFQHRISSIGQHSFTREMPSFMYYDGLGSDKKYVSGYELYLMNGLDFFVGKYQLAYKILEKQVKIGDFMPAEQFKKMHFALYISILAETGYANDPFTGEENPLSNRWLYGGGPSMSLLLFNNFLFQFSYCTNHLGEWGFYVHNRTSF